MLPPFAYEPLIVGLALRVPFLDVEVEAGQPVSGITQRPPSSPSLLCSVAKAGDEHEQEFEISCPAAVLAMIGAISSPVLAAGYDDPAFTGDGSTGYNVHIGDS
jgi:hypothetical protein